MAVELCSDNSGMSPRISFSLDLCHFDDVPVDQRPLRSKPSSFDFDFNVGEQPSSSADELFSDGKILPTEIKTRLDSTVPSKETQRSSPPPPAPSLPPPAHEDVNVDSTKEGSKEDEKQSGSSKSSSSSFWGFKRSRSFSCGSGYGRSLCPLPLLSRSNSTGSTPNHVKHQPSNNNNNPNKHINSHKNASSTSYHHHHKPPLKKNGYNKPYGSATVHVNPVLNVPSGNLFGLGSIFFNGSKAKNQCKRK